MGVGVVEESRLVKKADDLRIVINFGESGISDGDAIVDAGSSENKSLSEKGIRKYRKIIIYNWCDDVTY